jgi:hypothetical protein
MFQPATMPHSTGEAAGGVGVECELEQLLCPFGAASVLGEQDLLHGFVHSRYVCDEPVADLRELQVSDEGVAVIIVWEGLGVEHVGPEFPALASA